jgi:hypothetical protein
VGCQNIELKHVAPSAEEDWKDELAIVGIGLEEILRKTISKCCDALID